VPAFGRRVSKDERDRRFTVAPPRSQRRYRYWYQGGARLDQNGYPHCVGYAWTHYLEDGPITQPKVFGTNSYADSLYYDCQKVDEWPGENYEGTSVRAGAKVLQSRSLVGSYQWAFSVDAVVQTLLELGPVVMGTTWFQGMSYPDPTTRMVEPTGSNQGGHAYVLNGVSLDQEFVRLKNSWGLDWGFKGHARMSFETLETLLADDGEACLAVEREAT
jgi:hypothetical protein